MSEFEIEQEEKQEQQKLEEFDPEEIGEREGFTNSMMKTIVEKSEQEEFSQQDKEQISESVQGLTDPKNVEQTRKFLLKKNKKFLITLLVIIGSLPITGTGVVILWKLIADAIKKADEEVKQD